MKEKILTYKGFSVGDNVFFYFNYIRPCVEGTIVEVMENYHDDSLYFRVKWKSRGASCVHYKRIFKSKELCMKYKNNYLENYSNFVKEKNQIMDTTINIDFNLELFNIKPSNKDTENEKEK